MKIHNIMEEIVVEKVGEVLGDEVALERQGVNPSYQSRWDVVCYVLNRIKPYYMMSGRGLAHLEKGYQDKLQRDADLVALIFEGLRKVTGTQRPHSGDYEGEATPEGLFFNFPQMAGRIFTGATFEPASNVEAVLLLGGQVMRSIDPNWPNPYAIAPRTAGVYSFWPYPVRAQSSGETRDFELELSVTDPQYEPLSHFFSLALVAEEGFLSYKKNQRRLSIADLHLNVR